MDKGIFDIINTAASQTMASASLVTSAIDGHYARLYREDPSIRGLKRFLAESAPLPDMAAQLAARSLTEYQDATALYRTAFNPDNPGNPETLAIALQQLRVLIESLRLIAARRFKAALVSRSSIAPATVTSLRVLNRAGQQHQVSDMIYLTARKAAIDIFNEAQLDGLAFEGQKLASAFHLDPEHHTHGAAFLIDDSMTGLPHYRDVQDKWFHPRSNAVVDRSS